MRLGWDCRVVSVAKLRSGRAGVLGVGWGVRRGVRAGSASAVALLGSGIMRVIWGIRVGVLAGTESCWSVHPTIQTQMQIINEMGRHPHCITSNIPQYPTYNRLYPTLYSNMGTL